MEHEKEEIIKKLQIEKDLLVKAINHVDSFIDKLCLEQDQIRSWLHDSVHDPDPTPQSTPMFHVVPGTSQSAPVKSTSPVKNKPVFIMNDEEENIEAINSQPLALDLDLDELMAPPNTQ